MRRIVLALLPALQLIGATLPQDHLSKDEYADIVRMVFKYIYAHEEICGGILNDERWMPAGTDCFIPCEYTSNVCLLKAHDRSDPHQYCKQLPSRCVAGIRREVGTSYLVPTQAPVDPALYYYGRGPAPTMRSLPEEQLHPIEKEIYEAITMHAQVYMPEKSLKSIERDNQILFDPSSNQVFGPPRSAQTRVPPSQPPAHVPYLLPTESNPYLEQYFRGRKNYLAGTDPLPVSSASQLAAPPRAGNSEGLGNRKKTSAHTILYEGANGEVIARGPSLDQKSPPLPIFLTDDKAASEGRDGTRKLVELSEEQLLGSGFKQSSGATRDQANRGESLSHVSGKRVDLFASCCQWAVAGMCDSHWRKVRHVCTKSCGSMVCEEANGMRACSRVLDVDITECYDSLPKLIGLRRPESSHEAPEFEQSLKDSTKSQIESTSLYLADSVKTRHTSKGREDHPTTTTSKTSSAPSTTAKVTIRPQRRTSTTAPQAKRRSESVVIGNRGPPVKPRFVPKPAKIQHEPSSPILPRIVNAPSAPPIYHSQHCQSQDRPGKANNNSQPSAQKRFNVHNGDFRLPGHATNRGRGNESSSSSPRRRPIPSRNN
ncbi:hypothetical protein PENTCL1PPCAC_28363, partial [Pristionchus entomophagus]